MSTKGNIVFQAVDNEKKIYIVQTTAVTSLLTRVTIISLAVTKRLKGNTFEE